MPYFTIDDLIACGGTVVEKEVDGLGKIKVAKFTNKDLEEQGLYIKKLADSGDPMRALKTKFAIVAVALRKEDGSRLFASIEEAEPIFQKMPYEQFLLLFYAATLNVNELDDDSILERAKKSEAARSTDATA